MLNFYVILARHDMITDAGSFTYRRRNPKPLDYRQKSKEWRTFREHDF